MLCCPSFWSQKKDKVHPSAFTKSSSETPKETLQTVSLVVRAFLVDPEKKEEKKKTTLHSQERKTAERKETIPNGLANALAKLNEELKVLIVSSYLEYKKRVTDPYAFRSNKMMPEGKGMSRTLTEGKTNSTTPTPSEGNINSTTPTPSEGNINSTTLSPSEGNTKSATPTLTLLPITDKQLLVGGLPNFGNNCYVNASLQCLFTAESFCGELSYLLDKYIHRPEARFLSYFVKLWKVRNKSEAQDGISKDSLLLALINAVADINPEFTIYDQNDAHEFLCHCLTQMEESGRMLGWQKGAAPRCPVRSNFRFNMRNVITCSSCGSQQNNKLEWFYYISLPLVHDSVDQCLYDIVNNPTVLQSKCKVCEGEFASVRWTFHTLPRFLIVQLNRSKETEDYRLIKLENPVVIKPELQINAPEQSCVAGHTYQKSGFLSSLSQTNMNQTENSKAEARETDRNELGGSTSTYRLISVLSHVGSTADCGHFLSDCSSHIPHQWMTYNDELVTLTTEMDVLKMRSSSAYVLLYERVSTS